MSLLNIILIILAVASIILTIGVLCCFYQSGKISAEERKIEVFNEIDRYK